MVMGLGQIGSRPQGDMGVTMFLVMWTIMMVAMMLPTVAPMVLAHLSVVQKRGGGAFPTIVFVAGYLAVWSASGIVPYLAQVGFSQLPARAAESRWLPTLEGGILVAAGAYQAGHAFRQGQIASHQQRAKRTVNVHRSDLLTASFSGA